MSVAFEVFAILYLFVPAYVANMAAVYSRKYDILNYPLDCGLILRKDRVFGNNKTWRGFVFGVLAGQAVFLLQVLVGKLVYEPALFSYASLPIMLGAIMGAGAILGDAVESFFKRRIRIAPGQQLLVWDQIDFVLGAGLFTLLLWIEFWLAFIISLSVIFVVTILVQRIAFVNGIKDDPL